MGERCEQTAKQEPSSSHCLSSAHTHCTFPTAPRTLSQNCFSKREGGGGGRPCLCTGLFGGHFGMDFNLSSLLELLFEVGPVCAPTPPQALPRLCQTWRPQERPFSSIALANTSGNGDSPAPCSVPSSWYQHSNHLLGLPWRCTKVIFNTFILIQVFIVCFTAQGS